MTSLNRKFKEMAEQSIENAELEAKYLIIDRRLKETLIAKIFEQLKLAYEMNF